MDCFDLLAYLERARNTVSTKKLFELWEKVCRLYDGGHIGNYQLPEMKTVICPRLRSLCLLQRAVERSFSRLPDSDGSHLLRQA